MLSNIIIYVQYSKNPKNFHVMIIKPVNNSKVNKGTKDENVDESLLRVDLAGISDESREEYLDRYEGITSEILNTTRFKENSDLNTTYLGKIKYDSRRQFDDRREVFNNRTRVYSRKAIRWHRMSDIVRHWGK